MDWVSLVAEVSFPILVTFYLLTRIESKLDQLTFSIQALTREVSRGSGYGSPPPDRFGAEPRSFQVSETE
jgi:hypothetical protein